MLQCLEEGLYSSRQFGFQMDPKIRSQSPNFGKLGPVLGAELPFGSQKLPKGQPLSSIAILLFIGY